MTTGGTMKEVAKVLKKEMQGGWVDGLWQVNEAK